MMGVESQYNYTTWQVIEEYIPRKQLVDYRNKFSCFDKQKKGVLPLEDVALIFKELGHNVTTKQLRYLLCDVIGVESRNSSITTVDFQEFIAIMSIMASNCVAEDEMYLVFQQFDKNGDGYITASELRTLLESLGDEISEDELSEMIKAADTDGDGRVSYQEFVRVMTGSDEGSTQQVIPSCSKELKDINHNTLRGKISAITEVAEEEYESCETPRMRENTAHNKKSEVFLENGQKSPDVKQRRSWLSVFSVKRKLSTSGKKKMRSRYSCPELLNSLESKTLLNQRENNMEKDFSYSSSAILSRLSSNKKKPKRASY